MLNKSSSNSNLFGPNSYNVNQVKITKLAATPNAGLIDGTDNIHSGIVKALQAYSEGDICIGHAGFTITDGGT